MNPIYGQAVRTKTSQVLTPAHRIPQKDDNLYNYTGTKKIMFVNFYFDINTYKEMVPITQKPQHNHINRTPTYFISSPRNQIKW